MPMLNKLQLKNKLEYHYRAFGKSRISPDPLEFLHRFDNWKDIEAAGFISSTLAYGNIKQIIKTLDKLFKIIGGSPYEFISCYNYSKDHKIFKDIKHRFFSDLDIAALFESLSLSYKHYGSLKYLYLLYYFEGESNIKNSLSLFSQHLLELASTTGVESRGLKFMFPDPYKGSACKRLNLFMRWMVRKDELDFGIWNEIEKNKLVIPVDTHIAKICCILKLTRLKNVSWKMAEEITANLKSFDPADPVKYDFAICHIGMRKLQF